MFIFILYVFTTFQQTSFNIDMQFCLVGEAMQWGELCRIRHLVTRQYLAIENTKEGIKVCLKDYQKGSDTEPAVTFRLRPVIQGEESITYGSFARFYHPKTETWLHAMKGEIEHFVPTVPIRVKHDIW